MSLVVDVPAILEASESPLLGIHQSWRRVRLGDVATIINGFAFKSKMFSPVRGLPLIRIRDITEPRTACLYDGPFEKQYIVEPGSLLVGMDGEFKVARWRGPKGLLNQRVCNIKPDERFYVPKFLDLALPAYLDAIHSHTSSQTVTHLSSKTIADIPVPLPPIAEQQRIVAKVEMLLGQVNAARERLAKVPFIFKRFRDAVLAAACSGRLTEQWRNGRSIVPVAPLAEPDGEAREMMEGAFPDLTAMPDSWRWIAFSSVIADSFYGPRFAASDYVSKGIPTIRTTDMDFRGRIVLKDPPYVAPSLEEEKRFKLRDGDIVVTRTGATIGKSAVYRSSIGPAIPSAYLIRFRLAQDHLLPDYGLALLLSPFGQYLLGSGQTAVAQPNINAKTIAAFPLPLPPVAEQMEIVRCVNALLGLADTVEGRLSAATVRAEKLPDAILAKAFAGELVPIEADLARAEGRNYEPASVLLDRVRAQGGDAIAKPLRSLAGRLRRGDGTRSTRQREKRSRRDSRNRSRRPSSRR